MRDIPLPCVSLAECGRESVRAEACLPGCRPDSPPVLASQHRQSSHRLFQSELQVSPRLPPPSPPPPRSSSLDDSCTPSGPPILLPRQSSGLGLQRRWNSCPNSCTHLLATEMIGWAHYSHTIVMKWKRHQHQNGFLKKGIFHILKLHKFNDKLYITDRQQIDFFSPQQQH